MSAKIRSLAVSCDFLVYPNACRAVGSFFVEVVGRGSGTASTDVTLPSRTTSDENATKFSSARVTSGMLFSNVGAMSSMLFSNMGVSVDEK